MYSCPCCKNRTLPRPRDSTVGFICPVCFWENDVFINGRHQRSDENHGLTLAEAQENYVKHGVCDLDMQKYVRPPTDEEKSFA